MKEILPILFERFSHQYQNEVLNEHPLTSLQTFAYLKMVVSKKSSFSAFLNSRFSLLPSSICKTFCWKQLTIRTITSRFLYFWPHRSSCYILCLMAPSVFVRAPLIPKMNSKTYFLSFYRTSRWSRRVVAAYMILEKCLLLNNRIWYLSGLNQTGAIKSSGKRFLY